MKSFTLVLFGCSYVFTIAGENAVVCCYVGDNDNAYWTEDKTVQEARDYYRSLLNMGATKKVDVDDLLNFKKLTKMSLGELIS